MKFSDIILIVIIIILNTILLVNTISFANSSVAYVYYENTLVDEIDLTKDASYLYDAHNGKVEVTVRDEKVAITKETSPLNICSKQGYVDVNVISLICLPNRIVVEGANTSLDGVVR